MKVDISVAEWGDVGYVPLAKPVPGGGAPPTPPPGIDWVPSPLDMSLGLPRHLRTLARRQEPADRPGQVPGWPCGQGVSRAGARPLHLAVSGGDVLDADYRGAGGDEPVLRSGARAQATLPFDRDRYGAGLGRPRDADPTPPRAREHRPRGRHHRRRRLARALGPLGLGGLRPRPVRTGA